MTENTQGCLTNLRPRRAWVLKDTVQCATGQPLPSAVPCCTKHRTPPTVRKVVAERVQPAHLACLVVSGVVRHLELCLAEQVGCRLLSSHVHPVDGTRLSEAWQQHTQPHNNRHWVALSARWSTSQEVPLNCTGPRSAAEDCRASHAEGPPPRGALQHDAELAVRLLMLRCVQTSRMPR